MLAGSADEMGSFVRNLKTALDEQAQKQCALAAERDKIFAELQDLVGKIRTLVRYALQT